MKLLLLLILPALLLTKSARAQKSVEQVGQTWLGYFNQTRLSNRLGFWFDGNLRTKQEVFNDLSVGIARAGLTYYINDQVKFTLGYAYINFFPADAHKDVSQPEHRPWQQLQWHNRYKRLRTMQWLRLEERYRRKILNDSTLADGYNFNFRLRYNYMLTIPLARNVANSKWSAVAIDEIHINFGKQIVNNTFDQNRFFAGLAYHLNPHDNIQFGYMNVFQQLASGSDYRSIHSARIFFFHNLDLRKRQQQ